MFCNTHNVKHGQGEEQVVKDPVHTLLGEGVDGDAVAEQSQESQDQDQQSLGDPLEPVLVRNDVGRVAHHCNTPPQQLRSTHKCFPKCFSLSPDRLFAPLVAFSQSSQAVKEGKND